MTIAFTLPFWVIILILISIGVAGFLVICSFEQGSFDFLTPLIAMGWALFFIVVSIGMVLGKYIF